MALRRRVARPKEPNRPAGASSATEGTAERPSEAQQGHPTLFGPTTPLRYSTFETLVKRMQFPDGAELTRSGKFGN